MALLATPKEGRPDQPHAVAPAGAQQLGPGRCVQTCRGYDQGLDPPPPAVFSDTEHGSRGYGDDRQVDLLRQCGRRRHAAHAVQLGRARVDRVNPAGEAVIDDVLQDRPPDRSGAPARADDGNGARGQQVRQTGCIGRPFPFGDRVEVGAGAGITAAARQWEPQIIDTVFQGAVGPQPGVGEHLEHERVLRQGLRDEGADPPAAGQRDQVLEQQRADPLVVHVIGDGHSDLRGSGTVANQFVAADADQPAVQDRQQCGAAGCGLAAYPLRLPLGRDPAHAEKAQVQILRGHPGVHVPHRIEIVRACGPYLDRGPIGQQRVGTRPGLYSHVVPLVLSLTNGHASSAPGGLAKHGTHLPSSEVRTFGSLPADLRPLSAN